MVQMTESSQPSKEEVDALKKDISDFVEWHMKHGPHPASVVALQELTRLLLPHVPLATRSIFTRNLTQPVVPINDIADWQVQHSGASEHDNTAGATLLERGERAARCRMATLYRLAGRFGLFGLPNGSFTATARVGACDNHSESTPISFLVGPCGILPHEVTAGSFIKVQQNLAVTDAASSSTHPHFELRVVANGNTSMYAPRTVAEFHATFYRAAPHVRVICELRTTHARAVAAGRRGLALTAESAQLGKVTSLEYHEAVPEAMRSIAQKEAQEELAKQLHVIIEKHEVGERELSSLQAALAEAIARRDEEALKLTVHVKKADSHSHLAATASEGTKHHEAETDASAEGQSTAKHHAEPAHHEEGAAHHEEGAGHHEQGAGHHEEAAAHHEGAAHHEEGAAHHEEGAAHHEEGAPHHEEGAPHHEEGAPHHEEGAAHHEEAAEHHAEGAAHHDEGAIHNKEEVAHRIAAMDAEIGTQRTAIAQLEAVIANLRDEKATFLSRYNVMLRLQTDRLLAIRIESLSHRIGAAVADGGAPRIFFVRSFGALVCAASVEQALFAARTLQSACVTTLSLGKLAATADDSAVLPIEEELISIRDEANGGQVRLHAYELEFEVLARELDAAGSQTGYTYRLPGPLRTAHRAERPAELNEIEIPPVPLRLASASSDTDVLDLDGVEQPASSKSGRVEYRVTPSVFHREETDVPGSGRKLIRWISERGAERSAAGTVYRLDAPHTAFAPPGDARSLMMNRARVRDAYYNDTVTAGPQSRFESESEWDEAARRKEAVLSGRVDSTLVVGAASRGVLSKDALATGGAATVYYAPNPFQQPTATDRELRRYLKAQQILLPTDASGFLDERPDDTDAADDHETNAKANADTIPKRRASAGAGSGTGSAIVLSTPIPMGSNPLAAAAAQRAAELNEKRRQAAESEAASVTSSPASSLPPVIATASTAPTTPAHVSGTVQSSVAASSVQPVKLSVAAAGKAKTLPAGLTQEQIEAAACEGKKEKKKGGFRALFSRKKK